MLPEDFPIHQFNITYCSWCLVPVKMELRSWARGRQWCGIIHYYWWTASIKPRLLFSRADYASWGLSLSSVFLHGSQPSHNDIHEVHLRNPTIDEDLTCTLVAWWVAAMTQHRNIHESVFLSCNVHRGLLFTAGNYDTCYRETIKSAMLVIDDFPCISLPFQCFFLSYFALWLGPIF